MEKRINLRDLGWQCGDFPTGKYNSIIDVPGVSTSHITLKEGKGELNPKKGPIRTGVSIILPHQGNLFHEKVQAGLFIANGFGKSTGIPQIEELGVIETPIAITNTLNVGKVYDAIVENSIMENPEMGITTGSVNPVVTECFDGNLNDIQGRHVIESHVIDAIQNARKNFENPSPQEFGPIGATTGMATFDFKSGIGTSSRVLLGEKYKLDQDYHIGVFTAPNFGKFDDFLLYGFRMRDFLSKEKYLPQESDPEKMNKNNSGSIIVIIATDLPLNSRQLKRLAKRGSFGIARTGSPLSHGSGEFVFAFSTAKNVFHTPETLIEDQPRLNEYHPLMDIIFRMAIEAVQEAIYDSLINSQTMRGRDDSIRIALDPDDINYSSLVSKLKSTFNKEK